MFRNVHALFVYFDIVQILANISAYFQNSDLDFS